MKKSKSFLIFILLFFFPLMEAASFAKEPDLAFLIVDFKYSEKKGLKICEIQHGVDSAFKGDRLTVLGNGNIVPNLLLHLSKYNLPIKALPDSVADHYLKELLKDKELSSKNAPPCILFARGEGFNHLPDGDYILLDRSFIPYYRDKYKMSVLIGKECPSKPFFCLVEKTYRDDLANEIAQKIPGDVCVIKPRGAFHAQGIMIVRKEDLDRTLQLLLIDKELCKKSIDPSIYYWAFDPFSSFLVEEFCISDPKKEPRLGEGTFEPTYRLAVLLEYVNGTHTVHFLGGYCTFARCPMEKVGNLSDKHKAFSSAPFYGKMDPLVEEKAKPLLEPLFIRMHRQAMERDSFESESL